MKSNEEASRGGDIPINILKDATNTYLLSTTLSGFCKIYNTKYRLTYMLEKLKIYTQ